MSYRKENIFITPNSWEPQPLVAENDEAMAALFAEILQTGVYGFCFSAYEEGQKPGDILTEAQVRRRLGILKNHTKWIRSFSCIDGNELIPKIAHEFGLKTMVGAWLSDDADLNKKEIDGLIQLANDGFVNIAAVGNEVLYRKDLNEEQLLSTILYVKEQLAHLPEVKVGYVDAYYEFSQHPEITAACDVILCNCYPFWEGCSFEYSLNHMQQMFAQALQAADGKPVIITETGWPSMGEAIKGAIPGAKAAREYFINTQLWSANHDVPVFYFSSFDESWKVGAEGTVGAYWGIWDKEEKLKY